MTGGAGFVGSRLVRRLAESGAAVAMVDDLSVGLPLPVLPGPMRPGLAGWVGDIRDAPLMARVMAEFQPDTVIHLAAIHHIPTCEADPRHATDVNVVGFQTVLDAAAAHGCRRVVLASSGAVYDWGDGPLAEDAPLRPSDVYSVCKLANEQQLAVWCGRTGGSGAVARLFNVIGPGDPNGHFIPDMLHKLAAVPAGQRARVAMGNQHTRRDMVDVEDMARGLALLAAHDGGEPLLTVNFCSGDEIAMSGLAGLLAAALGVDAEFYSDPALRRPNDRASQLGAPGRAAELLGWRAEIPLDASVAAIVAHWRPHRP